MTVSSPSPETWPDPQTRSGRIARAGTLAAPIVVVLLLLLTLLPILYVFVGSFRSGPPGDPEAAFTLANWITAYTSPSYLRALGNTVVLGVVVSILSLAVGGLLAWIVARTDAPGRNALALMIVVPLMISNLITTLAWIALAAPNAGFINFYSRRWFGITLFDIYSFKGIVLVHVLHYASFAFLSVYAALRSIDAALEEASFMLGVGPFRTSLRMTLPLLAPTSATTLLVVFIFVAENFSVPTLLGAPVDFQTLPSLIYFNMAVTPAHPNLAAASGTMLLWIALVGALWQRRVSSRANRYVTIGGKGGRHRLTRLGPWRYAATAFAVLFVFLAVVLPYCVLALGSFLTFLTPNLRPGLFTLDNYRTLFVGDNLTPVFNSLGLSAIGGLAMALVYVGLSELLARTRGRWGQLANFVTIIPTALPALILGVGLIWAFVGLPIPIYGTLVILVIAYFTRYIGYGLRHAGNALAQVSGDLSEAARVSGATPVQAFWDIALPIIRPSVLSLWTVLFIFIFMEVSATILLYTSSTRTLPTVLWTYMGSGSQPRAFAIAVAQATLVFVILLLTDRRYGTLRNSLER